MENRKLNPAAARVNAGLRQKEVAKYIGVTPATLQNWEQGKTIPNVVSAKQLADLYKIDLNDISFTQKL